MMQQVEAVVEQLNKLAVNNGRGVSFTADEKLGVNIITVTNTTTGDVVRTIPTAVAIKAANGIKDFEDMLLKFKGLLHDSAA
jgi:flagellar protein FlaG